MEDNRAFSLLEVVPQTDELTLVRGQAYSELQVGQILFSENDNHLLEFEVTSISTYGQNIDELNRGMTGNLVIRGSSGASLKDVNFLLSKR